MGGFPSIPASQYLQAANMDPETRAVFHYLTNQYSGAGGGGLPSYVQGGGGGGQLAQALAPYGRGGQGIDQLLAPYGGPSAPGNVERALAPYMQAQGNPLLNNLGAYTEAAPVPNQLAAQLGAYTGGSTAGAGAGAAGATSTAGAGVGAGAGGGLPSYVRAAAGGGGGTAAAAAAETPEALGFLATLRAAGLRGVLSEAGPPMLASAVGNTLLNRAVKPSTGRSIAGDAITGAGIGASVGALGLPIPVVGEVTTGVGALVGAGVGALYGGLHGMFGAKGPTTADQAKQLNQAISVSGLPENAKGNILTTYNTLMALANSPKDKQAAFDQVKQMLVQEQVTNQASQQNTQMMLGSQALAQQFLSPVTKGIVDSAHQQAALTAQLAGTLPKEFQGPALLSASQGVATANRIAGAYANQMMSIGPLQALQQQNQAITGQLQSQLSQAAKTGTLGGGGSGSSSLAQLLAQQQSGAGASVATPGG